MNALKLLLDWLHANKTFMMILPLAKLLANKILFRQDRFRHVCKVHIVCIPDLRVWHILCYVDVRLWIDYEERLGIQHRPKILISLELRHDISDLHSEHHKPSWVGLLVRLTVSK